MKCDILCRELTSVGTEVYILPENFLVFKGMLSVENLGLQIISGVRSPVFTIIHHFSENVNDVYIFFKFPVVTCESQPVVCVNQYPESSIPFYTYKFVGI